MEEADKRMVDDQDRCEWVNVSSGTGSPGESRTKGSKTVVVVVVVVSLVIMTAGAQCKRHSFGRTICCIGVAMT